MIQYATHKPRNSIGQILSQDQCQMRGCLDYLPMVCIRVAVGSQCLKAVALKEPVHLLAEPTKRNRQSRQWPVTWQVNQFTYLHLAISKHNARCIITGDPPRGPQKDPERPHMQRQTCLGQRPPTRPLIWCLLNQIDELSETPDHPLSAPDPLSSSSFMLTSALSFPAIAHRSTGMHLGVSVNLLPSEWLI